MGHLSKPWGARLWGMGHLSKPWGARLRPDEAVGFGRWGDGFDQMRGLSSPWGARLRPDEGVLFAVGGTVCTCVSSAESKTKRAVHRILPRARGDPRCYVEGRPRRRHVPRDRRALRREPRDLREVPRIASPSSRRWPRRRSHFTSRSRQARPVPLPLNVAVTGGGRAPRSFAPSTRYPCSWPPAWSTS